MGGAEADALNQAGSIAKLSAIGCITDCGTQQRRIERKGLRETVPAEDCSFRCGHIVDLEIGVIAVEQRRPAARPVVQVVGWWRTPARCWAEAT